MQDQIKEVKQSMGQVELYCKAKTEQKKELPMRTYTPKDEGNAFRTDKHIKRVASAINLKDRK